MPGWPGAYWCRTTASPASARPAGCAVLSGSVDDRGTRIADTVLACQATLTGDAAIAYDEVPPVLRVGATVSAMRSLAPDIAEVVLALNAPLEMLPGQYLNVRFAGFPGRDYSPAPDLDGGYDPGEARLHVRLLPGGIVSGAIGRAIRPGHKAQIRGPLGAAFLRPGSGPLILVGGGTGFAPVWSVARAARLGQPGRDLFLVTGMRRREEVYMESALDWLVDHGALEAFATVEEDPGNRFRPGRPTHYLPSLGVDDTVIVAGARRPRRGGAPQGGGGGCAGACRSFRRQPRDAVHGRAADADAARRRAGREHPVAAPARGRARRPGRCPAAGATSPRPSLPNAARRRPDGAPARGG